MLTEASDWESRTCAPGRCLAPTLTWLVGQGEPILARLRLGVGRPSDYLRLGGEQGGRDGETRERCAVGEETT